ncbi:MAG: hypothetical protein M3Y50_12170 [Acidobacteriota bacterium]|nr:hypothetical protein [Acidobacteriota bacterium]
MQAPASRNNSSIKILCTAALLLATSACNNGKSAPTNDNFIRGLNNYFLEHTECLLPNTRFPLETTDKAQIKQMDSLVKASLLEKNVDAGVNTARYIPSANGTRFAPHFCFGHREVLTIDSSSPLAVQNGFKVTNVTYRYKMQDVPVWAETAEVKAAFPAMALATSGNATAKATLAQSPVGWQVPD